MTIERWLPIPGYEGRYEVSSLGDVVSLRFAKSHERKSLKKVDQRGYDRVYLRAPKIRGRWFSVHILVMLAFIGPRPDGMHVNHIDGHKKNNALANLEYCTPAQNQKHSFALGLQSLKGEKHTRAKLTDEAIADIRSRALSGETQISIAKLYGVSQGAISLVIRKKRWGHIVENTPRIMVLQ